MTSEVTIRGFGGVDEVLGMQGPIERVLCPVAEHIGPCEVPWGFSVSEADDLVLGIYASHETAVEVAERVRGVVGAREAVLTQGTPGWFDGLEEQWRIEQGS